MGAKYSQTERKKKETKNFNNKYNQYETNDYMSSNIYSKENTDNSSVLTAETSRPKEKSIKFLFRIKIDRENMKLRGTFANNLLEKINMEKNEKTGYFEKVMDLPPNSKFQFKFNDGDEWFNSNEYVIDPDNEGNKNNVIDLSDPKVLEDNQKRLAESDIKNSGESKKKYNNRIPERSEMNITAPGIICHYCPIFDINYQSNQLMLFQNKFMKFKEKNIYNENNTFKKILVWPHEKLMHLCVNVEDIINEDKGPYRYSTTVRNKHKFLTIVYFCSK